MEKSRLTRDGTAETVSRCQILTRERGQGNIIFPCSADHEQDRQPCPVDPYSFYIILQYIMKTILYWYVRRGEKSRIGLLIDAGWQPIR